MHAVEQEPTELDRVLLGSEPRTPFLALDLAIFEANMRDLAARCEAAGVELIPHAKTHRTVELGVRQLRLGARGLCVATVGEAAAFAAAGAPWIVLAYPVVGAAVEEAFAVAQTARLTLATDSVVAARAIGDRFAAAGQRADVYLIVDTGLGRAGVRPDDAAELAAAVAALDGVTVTGIMTHEGSVYDAAGPDDRDARAVAAAELMTGVAAAIRRRGVPVRDVSMGASASARAVLAVPGVTHIRPGIFAFNDLGQIGLRNAGLADCAVRVVATVVSRPEPGRACIDAGSKALGQDLLPSETLRAWHPGHGLIVGAPGWRLDRLSEEHGWLRPADGVAPAPLAVGQRVTVVPNHVCTAFFCSGFVHVYRDGERVAGWPAIDRAAR
ncbi:alanine racemase [Jiangella muralis]|uniref:alanine racemase n=1 Tax=Jiangella muralis TaxID=702383 RepID=UPI00069F9C86|nr:alanine racemase [Jiangella muralis]